MNFNDQQIQNQAKSLLEEKMNLSSFDINIETRDGRIQLSGMVDVLAEKKFAERILSKLPGVKGVENDITVAMDNEITDKDITKDVEQKFEQFKVDAKQIGFKVNDGNVTLIGTTENEYLVNKAIEAVESTRGVKDVNIQVHVGKAVEVDDASISSTIAMAFAEADIIDGTDIHAETKHGIVRLKGWVSSEKIMEKAEEIASQVTGVRKVISELETPENTDNVDINSTNRLRKLLADNGLSMIKAYVVNGNAFLEGRVASVDQIKKVEELCYELDEIHGITNDLKVVLH